MAAPPGVAKYLQPAEAKKEDDADDGDEDDGRHRPGRDVLGVAVERERERECVSAFGQNVTI